MPFNPPIKIRELERKGVLSEKRFFRLLSEHNNYVDPKTVIDFYMGLVRLLSKELKDNGVVHLPHIGYIALLKQKIIPRKLGKTFIGGSTGYTIKFYPKEAWRKYFKKIEERPGLEGKLDPREKILGENLDDMSNIR